MTSPYSSASQARMRDAGRIPSGGFRNVLVHEYIRVNDDIVIGRLKALGDLEDFVNQVAAFVTGA
jgi:Ribonuclease HepT-like